MLVSISPVVTVAYVFLLMLERRHDHYSRVFINIAANFIRIIHKNLEDIGSLAIVNSSLNKGYVCM